MEISRIEREVTYRLTDNNGEEHSYTIASSFDANEKNPITYICGKHSYEEIEVPNSELPFLIETLNLFAQDYSLINKQP